MLSTAVAPEDVARSRSAATPPVPAELAGEAVAVWSEPISLLSYEPAAPASMPAFLDRRVYQGSSGRVYPLPFIDRIESQPRFREWDAIHLENPWIRVVILPELGGRIHVAYDKRADYDFFYRNATIKPALVGLAGPWMAGGVEFNWPQHHRPATWLPVQTTIERAEDGSVTVWCSDHDPFTRMKGMHGIRLTPDAARLELDVRLYNRSELTETFLWWANVAAEATPDYQSFFPRDVRLVADHARRAVVSFPRADRPYYGVDYPARRHRTFESGGICWTEDRLDFYRNIPVPTSYMCVGSRGMFFGGYDHLRDAGFVHVADPTISVGKKQWTWGNHQFGHAWDQNLSDDGSAYVELMAGVYTDNQPDFSYIQPGETKTFTQSWIPISSIGVPLTATRDAVLSADVRDGRGSVGVVSAIDLTAWLLVSTDKEDLLEETLTLVAGQPITKHFTVSDEVGIDDLRIELTQPRPGRAARVVLAWRGPGAPTGREAATEPPVPDQVVSVSELCLIARHLEQNRHATRSPEPYLEEALRRDPANPDAATQLGVRRLRQARFPEAEALLRSAYERLGHYNLNPPDTQTAYYLGLTLRHLGRTAEAFDHFARASWGRQWAAPALWQMARIECAGGREAEAVDHLTSALRREPDHLQARATLVWALRRIGRWDEAEALLEASRQLDKLDAWLRDLASLPIDADEQTHLDVALEYLALGDAAAAGRVLDASRHAPRPLGAPRAALTRALLLGERPEDSPWLFPSRLAEHDLLVTRLAGSTTGLDDPSTRALAFTALGCWYYAHERSEDAIVTWEQAVAADPANCEAWRNLGLARYNTSGDLDSARSCYARALALRPDDHRLAYEADQLASLAGAPIDQRLAVLGPDGVPLDRDDATIVWANLSISAGRPEEALEVLRSRHFQPWEGGEGQALAAWDRAHLNLALAQVSQGNPDAAVRTLTAALTPPRSLGEQRHYLANTSQLHLALGEALHDAGREQEALEAWGTAAKQHSDFVDMSPEEFSEASYFSIRALQRLGRQPEATDLTDSWQTWLDDWTTRSPLAPYFATSLPELLLFSVDPRIIKNHRVRTMRAEIHALRGDMTEAAADLTVLLDEKPDDAMAHDLLLHLTRRES